MHINNVALAGLVEEGRFRFHKSIGPSLPQSDTNRLIARVSIDYLHEAFQSAMVDIHCAAAEFGRTSQILFQLLAQEGRPVAFAQTVLVNVKGSTPTVWQDDYRAAMRPWMLKP